MAAASLLFSLSGSAQRLASGNRDLKPSSFFSRRDSIMNISRELSLSLPLGGVQSDRGELPYVRVKH